MSTVSVGWGKPSIYVRKIVSGDTKGEWKQFATPVEGTTELTPTQGDKLEAAIEGGTNEAVKYKKNTYQLAFDVRQVPERTDPIEDVDGVVEGEFEVKVIPENTSAQAIYIARSACNVQTKFDTENGTVNTYTFDVLQPESGKQVVHGVAADIFDASGNYQEKSE